MNLDLEKISRTIGKAEEAFNKKKYNEATIILDNLILTYPDYAPIYKTMGLILVKTNRAVQALPYLKKATELEPNEVEYWNILGVSYKVCKMWEDALDSFRKSLNLLRDDRQIMYEIALIYHTIKDNDKALSTIQKLSVSNTDTYEYIWLYAKILNKAYQKENALKQYKTLIGRYTPNMPNQILKEWYNMIEDKGDSNDILSWLQKRIGDYPNNATLKWLYGKALFNTLKYEEGLYMMILAFELEPYNEEITYRLGISYYVVGDKEKAKYFLDKTIKINPLHSPSLRVYGIYHKYCCGDEPFKRLNFASCYIDEMPTEAKSQMHYALGKAYDDIDDLRTAFEHYRRGGLLHAQDKHNEYHELKYLQESFSTMRDDFLFADKGQQGCKSNKPIFIIGMPRSGSTLIEQVLSSIDDVFGAGELYYSLQSLHNIQVGKIKLDLQTHNNLNGASHKQRGEHYLSLIENLAPKESRRIIDKMPDNFKWLGFIKLILPNAYFIHSRRHPIETCLSAYRLYFTEGHFWSDDLSILGKYYRTYVETMKLWRELLPPNSILQATT